LWVTGWAESVAPDWPRHFLQIQTGPEPRHNSRPVAGFSFGRRARRRRSPKAHVHALFSCEPLHRRTLFLFLRFELLVRTAPKFPRGGVLRSYAEWRLPPELVEQARYREHDPGVKRGKTAEQ
jgi:hypothetical protein